MNRFKKTTVNKKKWQDDIEQGQNIDVLKQYKPIITKQSQQNQQIQQKDQKQQKQIKQQEKVDQNKNKKIKQYDWMSDSDIQEDKNKVPTQTNKIQQQIKEQGYIDLFITKIPIKLKQQQITQYLQKYGVVKDIFMPLIEGTQFHKGKAFVQFVPKDNGFLQMQQHKIRNHEIMISNKIVFNNNKSKGSDEQDNNSQKRSRSRSRSN